MSTKPRSAIFCWLRGAKQPSLLKMKLSPDFQETDWFIGQRYCRTSTGEKSSTSWSILGSEHTKNERVLLQHIIISPSQFICLYNWGWEKLFEKIFIWSSPEDLFYGCRYLNLGNFCWVGLLQHVHIELWYAIFHCFAALCSLQILVIW